jgi:hypothetical protein
MKARKTRLCLLRGLYWANQGMLQAVRALQEAELPSSALLPMSDILNDELRRTQAMIEQTRNIMNHTLADWIERKE